MHPHAHAHINMWAHMHINMNNHENKRKVIIYLSVSNARKTKLILKMHSTWLVLCNFSLRRIGNLLLLQEINWKYFSILMFYTIMAENLNKVPQWTCCNLTLTVLMACTPILLQLETYLKFVFNFIFHYILTKIFRKKTLHHCEDFIESLL